MPAFGAGSVLIACAVLAGVLSSSVITSSSVHSATLDEIREDKRSVERRITATGEALDAASARITRAMRRYERVTTRLEQARGTHREAVRTARIARAQARSAQAAFERTQSAYALAEHQRWVVEGQVEDVSEQMDSMIRAVYKQGPFTEIEVVLSASDPGDFTARLASVDTIARAQRGMERALLVTQGDLVRQGVRLETLRIEAEAGEAAARRASESADEAEDRAKAQQQRLNRLAKKRSAALKTARVHKSAIKDRLAELEEEQQELAAAAAKAAREEARRRAAAAAAGNSLAPTGALRWPVSGGVISSRVGPRTHPVFGYASCHTGIDIAAPSGTPVLAAEAGTVASISSGGAYGNAVLVAHGDGLTTFYAHLSSVAVSTGRQVALGEQIGGVGSTGWSTGPHLHFETRINGTAYDPWGWFGGSRTPVSC